LLDVEEEGESCDVVVLWCLKSSHRQAKLRVVWREVKSQVLLAKESQGEEGLQQDSRGTWMRMPAVQDSKIKQGLGKRRASTVGIESELGLYLVVDPERRAKGVVDAIG
jgi:hypothetical protein